MAIYFAIYCIHLRTLFYPEILLFDSSDLCFLSSRRSAFIVIMYLNFVSVSWICLSVSVCLRCRCTSVSPYTRGLHFHLLAYTRPWYICKGVDVTCVCVCANGLQTSPGIHIFSPVNKKNGWSVCVYRWRNAESRRCSVSRPSGVCLTVSW